MTWDFADSEDLFTIRSFKSQNYSEDLNDAVIEDPYAIKQLEDKKTKTLDEDD